MSSITKILENISLPSEKTIRKKPIALAANDAELFSAEYEKLLPSVVPKKLEQAWVLPNGRLIQGVVLNAQQFNIRLGWKRLVREYLKSILSIVSSRRITRFNAAIFVTNSNSHNFFHWFGDVLQKLELLEEILPGVAGVDLVVVIPNGHDNSYMDQSLRAFGLNFYRQQKNEIIKAREFVLLPDIAPTGNYRKEYIFKLRGRLRGFWLDKYEGDDKHDRVYITRRSASKRKVVNENDIRPFLESHGFVIVDFDLLSFEAQVRYILNCKVLVSLHGAALTHMMWMSEAGKVLEIRSRGDHHNNCYYSLASDLGHDYYYALADKLDPKQTTQAANFFIDPEYFNSQLLKML